MDNDFNNLAGSSIVKLVEQAINYACALKASDIHLDPQLKNIRLRFRIDGLLRDVATLDEDFCPEIISRIKVLAGLRTDEHQAPQDGRFRLELEDGNFVDVRVSIVPTHYGQNAVMRLLVDQREDLSLENLGFSQDNYNKILAAVKKPHGLILATGPTGSGKTSTLYSLLKILNKPEVSIITIEDPIEYAIEGVEQIQVNHRRGFGFAQGLRSILRQDPDIILVGEIRDSETASIAVNAALTGHLVLSTLHTNDAATALPRLLDMKIEPFLISSTVSLVISQRLVRKLCRFCKGQGCGQCQKTGYSGRLGVQEVLAINDEIRKSILVKSEASQIKSLALQAGMADILQDGLDKACAGLTTLQEVSRVFYE